MNSVGVDNMEQEVGGMGTVARKARVPKVYRWDVVSECGNFMANKIALFEVPNLCPMCWQISVGIDETIGATELIGKAVEAACRSFGTCRAWAVISNQGISLALKN